jgi:hypothetical protein
MDISIPHTIIPTKPPEMQRTRPTVQRRKRATHPKLVPPFPTISLVSDILSIEPTDILPQVAPAADFVSPSSPIDNNLTINVQNDVADSRSVFSVATANRTDSMEFMSVEDSLMQKTPNAGIMENEMKALVAETTSIISDHVSSDPLTANKSEDGPCSYAFMTSNYLWPVANSDDPLTSNPSGVTQYPEADDLRGWTEDGSDERLEDNALLGASFRYITCHLTENDNTDNMSGRAVSVFGGVRGDYFGLVTEEDMDSVPQQSQSQPKIVKSQQRKTRVLGVTSRRRLTTQSSIKAEEKEIFRVVETVRTEEDDENNSEEVIDELTESERVENKFERDVSTSSTTLKPTPSSDDTGKCVITAQTSSTDTTTGYHIPHQTDDLQDTVGETHSDRNISSPTASFAPSECESSLSINDEAPLSTSQIANQSEENVPSISKRQSAARPLYQMTGNISRTEQYLEAGQVQSEEDDQLPQVEIRQEHMLPQKELGSIRLPTPPKPYLQKPKKAMKRTPLPVPLSRIDFAIYEPNSGTMSLNPFALQHENSQARCHSTLNIKEPRRVLAVSVIGTSMSKTKSSWSKSSSVKLPASGLSASSSPSSAPSNTYLSSHVNRASWNVALTGPSKHNSFSYLSASKSRSYRDNILSSPPSQPSTPLWSSSLRNHSRESSVPTLPHISSRSSQYNALV